MPTLESAAEFFVIGDPIPGLDAWRAQQQRRQFWWLTFNCFGPDYREGVDTQGNPIIRQHEREDDADYARRKENATPYCPSGQIIRQYNNFVFRKKPNLNIETDKFRDFNANVDGLGTDSVTFWQELLLEAQVARESYCLIDNNNTTGLDTMTRAQAESSGIRVFWRDIKASQVLWTRDFMGRMVEAAVLLQQSDGQWIIWIANQEKYRIITLRLEDNTLTHPAPDDFIVAEIGPILNHGYITLPLIRLRPRFGTVSQIAPLAELQKKLTRLLSILDEELLNNTFTQMVVTGQAAPQSTGDQQTKQQEVNFGPMKIMFLPNPGAGITPVGADVAQAESLRKSIMAILEQIFKTAGIATDVVQDNGGVESGIAKQFKFNDLSANLAALSSGVQQAHREAEIISLEAMGINDESETPVQYDTDFTLPNFNAELNDLVVALAAGLPPTVAKTIAKRFAERNLSLSDEDAEIFNLELDSGQKYGTVQLNPTGSTDVS